MKFLVILICLMVNYLWLKDFDRFDDGWFFRFRCKVDSWTEGLTEKLSAPWLLSVAAIYLAPVLVLALLLLAANGAMYGLPTMLIHILVLLIAFDRTQPGKLASEFLERWNSGDMEACKFYLQQELSAPESLNIDDEKALSGFFSKQLAYRCFEKMFVMFFGYMITGPIGILISYISYQLRDSHQSGQSETQLELVKNIILILEWVPLRLVALTFSFAGNFVRCFDSLKRSFWVSGQASGNAELLYSHASSALSGLVSLDDDGEHLELDERAQVMAEVTALQGLLERSQAIWLIVLALITIFGMSA